MARSSALDNTNMDTTHDPRSEPCLTVRHETVSSHKSRTRDQDLTVMKEHTLDLKRAAELARKLKASGGKDTPQRSTESRGTLPSLPEPNAKKTTASDANIAKNLTTKNNGAPNTVTTNNTNKTSNDATQDIAHVVLDAHHVKEELLAQIATIKRIAQLSATVRLTSDDLRTPTTDAALRNDKIDQMIQDIVDLYVPLFERELRYTLRKDILRQLISPPPTPSDI